MMAVAGTDLIATVPRPLIAGWADDSAISITRPPEELVLISGVLIWHPRLDSDPAHRWLRSVIRAAASKRA